VSTYSRLVAADETTFSLAPVVHAQLAVELADTSNEVGAAVRDPGVFLLSDYVTNAATDLTSAIQAFLDARANGDTVVVNTGTWRVDGTLTMAQNNFTLHLRPGSIIDRSAGSAVVDGIAASGTGFVLEGFGTIKSPATWDGTNVAPTYAVVHCTGAAPTVRDITLTNVPKVGIWSKDADGTTVVTGITVIGNYPAASWTGVETVHYGIHHDPSATDSRIKALNNTVSSCVQGVFLGNYGAGSSTGSILSGNDIMGCHNHAVYGSASVTNVTVTANTVTDCATPIAMTGEGHDVSHNQFTTTGTGGNLNAACSINMRDAIGCTVSFNQMVGDLSSSSGPAIDISTLSGATIRSNRVIGNRISVTGTNTGIGIRVGSGTATDVTDNIVQGNVVSGPGVAFQGVIAIFASDSVGIGNKILDNSIVVKGNTNGIYVTGCIGTDVRGNHIRLEYSAPSAITLGAMYFTGTSRSTRFSENDITCTSAYGTNIALRAAWEAGGTLTNRIGPNRYSMDLTLLTSATIHVLQGDSSSVLDEALPGAPGTVCGPGSRWMRTDGGASTTLYIKETAAGSATWRAV